MPVAFVSLPLVIYHRLVLIYLILIAIAREGRKTTNEEKKNYDSSENYLLIIQ
jgi:flagellar biosynthesis protein FliR